MANMVSDGRTSARVCGLAELRCCGDVVTSTCRPAADFLRCTRTREALSRELTMHFAALRTA